MRITTDHAASSYGQPVILDDEGRLLDYRPGLTAVLTQLGWDRLTLAIRTGYTPRTVDSWWSTRTVPTNALNMLANALERITTEKQ